MECSNQTFLLNGECLSECPIGYLANPTLNKCQGSSSSSSFFFSLPNWIIQNIIVACSYGCSECVGINSDQCSNCTSPFLLSSTYCVSSLECSAFGYKENSLCLCNFFSFFSIQLIRNNNKYKNKNKTVCDPSCSKCNGPNSTNCLECLESKYLLDRKCVDECPFGFFIYENQCQGTFFIVLFLFLFLYLFFVQLNNSFILLIF